jgi:hypothetical protein
MEARLRGAAAPSSSLLAEFVAHGCTRIASVAPAAKAEIDRLIQSTAWTDATLALLALELPAWMLRRLVREDGEWFCSLSRRPWLPLGLDEVAVASHESLPLAILLALLQARGAAIENAHSPTTVPHARSPSGYAMCCDNFR